MTMFVDAVPSEDEIGSAKASLDMIIAVGFGIAQVTKDNEIIYQETINGNVFRRLREFEEMAKIDPNHDWRVLLEAPLNSREWQRKADDEWVVISVGPGFA